LVPDLTSRVVVVGGFTKQTQHSDKPFCFDNAGHIYVNVGAPSNACQKDDRSAGSPGMEPCPLLKLHGGIWQFDANKTAQTQAKDGIRYATGLRNCMALEWNNSVNSLYAVQHGRDQLHEFWKALYSEEANAELPAEEFFQINKGDDFGWPYCYFDPSQNKKMLSPEYGGDGKKQGQCANVKQPILAFPAHIAPNDLVFYTGDKFPEKYHNGAFVAFHGSWNRSPLEQKGFLVAFVPMTDGKITGAWEVFADGFSGGGSIKSPDDAKHRPTGLGVSTDGALYVSDSKKGKIWKIVYEGEVQ
ncbi:MAG: PQQ-dependent sugar dehydrogenase, partial [Bacteroidota bacterium]